MHTHLSQLIRIEHCVKSVRDRSSSDPPSVFSRVRTEYGEILHISSYSVQMRENAGQKKIINKLIKCTIHLSID